MKIIRSNTYLAPLAILMVAPLMAGYLFRTETKEISESEAISILEYDFFNAENLHKEIQWNPTDCSVTLRETRLEACSLPNQTNERIRFIRLDSLVDDFAEYPARTVHISAEGDRQAIDLDFVDIRFATQYSERARESERKFNYILDQYRAEVGWGPKAATLSAVDFEVLHGFLDLSYDDRRTCGGHRVAWIYIDKASFPARLERGNEILRALSRLAAFCSRKGD